MKWSISYTWHGLTLRQWGLVAILIAFFVTPWWCGTLWLLGLI